MSFADTWAAANPDAGNGGSDNFDPPADGTYTVTLTDGDAFLSKKGDAYCKLQWTEPAQDYTWIVLLGFKSEGQANVTKRQIRELGVDVDQVGDLDDLAAAVKTKVGEYFTVTVKTNGKFRNTFVDGPAGQFATSDVPSDLSDFQPAQPTGDDDDVPFLWDGPRDYCDRYHSQRWAGWGQF